MHELRQSAARIDRQMQMLTAQGVTQPRAIIDRMITALPDLHRIWVQASDHQLVTLVREFPHFHRYATLMEEAAETERRRSSRPYDGLPEFSEPLKQQAAQLLTTAAALERSYQAPKGQGWKHDNQPRRDEMDPAHRRWLADLDRFRTSLRAEGLDPKALHFAEETFKALAGRLDRLRRDPQ